MIARFRALYGASPLHLLALVASLCIVAAAVVRWFDSGSDTLNILVWFAGAVVAHDLVLVPLYSLLDRIAFGRPRRPGPPPERPPARAYLRIPALLSALLLLVFFPLILQLGSATYMAASGLPPNVYLARWLLATGALFALSGLAYALRLLRARMDERRPDAVE